ncbi:hypothetical protein LMH87_010439 [Akanthomyces muscarius]|uniref:Peptide N-acetyl-beta-D-glucosaminyl asparaginase amidase A N-terminal domain-containing protein n=1 Tax=Akanthomyces muscarius TaxID=2231603 RepID=A0A9W8QG26_AKAMU|nr:hypothetical protein LMH87_010439 [Akanthomyces muscarius]KAJ4153974.1 hypothetical protein LMH87_010439 [Akanthomyces muscarius]
MNTMARVTWLAVVTLSAIAKTALAATVLPRALDYEDQASVLECFQVSNPVLSDKGLVSGTDIVGPANNSEKPVASCQQTLITYSFQSSYGHPYVSDYSPPSCDFNRVAMNLTVVSEGVQFDRLAIMYLGDIEVWRTSTAEPKSHPGISWTYWKDMTNYLSLWKGQQKLIFDLGNTVNDQYTGAFNVTLTATFFSVKATGEDDQQSPASQIMPISAKRGSDGKSSAFNYPGDTSVSLKIPQAAVRAIVSISATGQSDEEFWETNVPDSIQANATGYFGKSAFREARLLIDGQIAGLAWPYPVVFTGGISPPLHRPMVGIQAFDLLENEIDITPWLGLLCDGSDHTFSLQIVGEKEQKPGSYWIMTGKVFVWTDDGNQTTTGPAPQVTVDPVSLNASGGGDKGGPILYQQSINRSIRVSTELTIAGQKKKYAWNQRFSMKNDGNITNGGNDQSVNAIYEGQSTATSDSSPYFYVGFRYPFVMEITTSNEKDSLKLTTNLEQGMDLTVTGISAFDYGIGAFGNRLKAKVSGSVLQTTRKATASYYQAPDGSRTSGESESHQTYKFGGRGPSSNTTSQRFSNLAPLLYSRDVKVVGDRRVKDDVFVYRSNYKGHPDKMSAGKFVQGFAPVPNPQKPGMAKFMGKGDLASGATENLAVQWQT